MSEDKDELTDLTTETPEEDNNAHSNYGSYVIKYYSIW